MKILVVKDHFQGLKAAFDSDLEKVKKLKVGETYQVEIKQPRNVKFLRKFFALMNLVYDNQEVYDNLDRLRKDLTIEAGFYEEYVSFHGELKREAKSISFAKMSEVEFSEFYGKFIDTVIRILGWDGKDIEENIESYL